MAHELSIFQRIFKVHSALMGDFTYHNPVKLILTFSGIPGSGKTTLATILQKRYHAIRLNNDQIRDIIRNLMHTEDLVEIQSVMLQYFDYLREQVLAANNGVYILDSSIDRRYNEVSDFFIPRGYKIFIIKFSLPDDVIVERLKQRETDPSSYLARLEEWKQDNQRFEEIRKADFVINKGTQDEVDSLTKVLDSLIKG